MKAVGYALITLGAVALVRGLWLLTPVAGWIGLAVVAYVAGYHLSNRDDDGPTAGAPSGVTTMVVDPEAVADVLEERRRRGRPTVAFYGSSRINEA